ncbi:sterol desaturase family protein [Pedobacter montanisoli]|uniref:Sterol desaturase family protein n=1 Tax=Pedobacter montanisoli TaxID=2923277 RepID=A0ABS9ZYQ1_9SPHI|nr:sterol desaturase family protein [Pedobacter montanisoli]MCJ0743431.1 sterol desaturase family protein [Pedobacter montanisoli]
MEKTIHNKGQARLFEHPVLEMLTKTRPWVIYCIYIPICAFFIYYSYTRYHISSLNIFILFMVAGLSWTLVEYLAHRYLFHFEAKSALGKRLVYLFHENHHEYPRDTMRLFMPPVPSLIISSVVFLVFAALSWLLTHTIAYGLIYFSGFIIGYLIYVSMHYAIHAYAPPRFLKRLWRNHQLHHYKYPDKAFGVSSNFWDRVFGTLPPQKVNE